MNPLQKIALYASAAVFALGGGSAKAQEFDPPSNNVNGTVDAVSSPSKVRSQEEREFARIDSVITIIDTELGPFHYFAANPNDRTSFERNLPSSMDTITPAEARQFCHEVKDHFPNRPQLDEFQLSYVLTILDEKGAIYPDLFDKLTAAGITTISYYQTLEYLVQLARMVDTATIRPTVNEMHITHLERFQGNTLDEAALNLDPAYKPGRPILLILYNSNDPNYAFMGEDRTLEHMSKHYRLLIYEIHSGIDEICDIVEKTGKRFGKIHETIPAAHSFAGGMDFDGKNLTLFDYDKLAKVREYLDPRGRCIVIGCSAGQGDYSIGLAFADAWNIDTYAPSNDTKAHALVLNDSGEIGEINFPTAKADEPVETKCFPAGSQHPYAKYITALETAIQHPGSPFDSLTTKQLQKAATMMTAFDLWSYVKYRNTPGITGE